MSPTSIRFFVLAVTSALLSLVASFFQRWYLSAAMAFIFVILSLAGFVFVREKDKEAPIWAFILLPIILFIVAWFFNIPEGWF